MTIDPLTLRGEVFDRVVLETVRDLGTATLMDVIAVMGANETTKTRFRVATDRLRASGDLYSWIGGPSFRPTRYFSTSPVNTDAWTGAK